MVKTNGKPAQKGAQAKAQPEAEKPEREGPAFVSRVGRIKAAVWRNEHEVNGVWYSVTVTRSYKVGEEWRQATNFGKDDLLVVAEVCRQAFLWIIQQNGTQSPATNEAAEAEEEIPF